MESDRSAVRIDGGRADHRRRLSRTHGGAPPRRYQGWDFADRARPPAHCSAMGGEASVDRSGFAYRTAARAEAKGKISDPRSGPSTDPSVRDAAPEAVRSSRVRNRRPGKRAAGSYLGPLLLRSK